MSEVLILMKLEKKILYKKFKKNKKVIEKTIAFLFFCYIILLKIDK